MIAVESVNGNVRGQGNFATFVCSAGESLPQTTFTWYKDGKLLSPSDRVSISTVERQSTLILKDLDVQNDGGHYTCRATNPVGFRETSVNLAVESKWPLTFNP